MRCYILRGVVLAALAGMIAVPSALAQTSTPEQRRLEDLRRSTAQPTLAPAPLQGFDIDGCGVVAFDQVLADPDNVPLNLCYAQTLLRAGNVKSAAPVMERVLLLDPGLTNVRLTYAILLFRLDSKELAETHLRILKESNLTAAQTAMVDDYLERVTDGQRTLRLNTSLSAGVHHDTNKNAFPSRAKFESRASATGEVDPNAVNPAGGFFRASKNADLGFVEIGSAEVVWDPGFQDGHELFAGGTLLYDTQIENEEFDIRFYQAQSGGRFKFGWFDLDADLTGGKADVGGKHFLQSGGLNFRFTRDMRAWVEGLGLSLGTGILYEDFERTTTAADNDSRDGWTYSVAPGATYVVTDWLRTGLTYKHSRKLAAGLRTFALVAGTAPILVDSKHESYQQHEVGLNGTVLLPRGAFAVANAGWQWKLFDDFDPADSVRRRKDVTYTTGLLLGAPISAIPGTENWMPEVKDVTLTVGVDYLVANSEIANYNYRNLKTNFMVNKRFDF